MALTTLTSKGRVTIPKQIRESLNLKTGDKIEIVVTEKGEAIIRPVSRKVDDVFCMLHQADRKAVSVKAMNDAVNKHMKVRYQ
ncbi:looped-hinge helix DNA binding domain-containing protein, AbrB family [Nitrosomonas sp. Nm51]|uniref:AbrB/MazE/SpoVT family DNA-binding domain-containing protein n=1 Tax=Nitrosomonas sp. Nm51 TaxID=133720 RepID=UPI0008D0DBAB|nr:AbrB/MazE/SpoVT family DNA-binding domain-containing protein [Nitrosomonas sp. Nm51]SER19753.1 looped-hinge helix DNA binding domain-containing protein, AbrB family [Nitrosomonas sp. Nm51]